MGIIKLVLTAALLDQALILDKCLSPDPTCSTEGITSFTESNINIKISYSYICCHIMEYYFFFSILHS